MRRRRISYALGGLLVFGLLWILATGFLAKRQQVQLEAQLRKVQYLVAAGRVSDAQQAAADIPSMVRRGHLLTSGPAWWTAAHLPVVGTPFEIARGTSSASLTVGTDVLPPLLDVAASLDPNRLRVSGNSVDLKPLIAAEPTLSKASARIDSAVATLDGLPSSSWLTPLNSTRLRLEATLRSVGGYVDAAARSAQVLPTLLSQHGTKRYFVALQNEAELRGTGGLPGAFAIAEVTNGRVKFTHFASDLELLPVANRQLIPTGLDFGPDYDALYGVMRSTSFFTSGNLSPHFPYAARIWATMWQKKAGQRVDGVVALDPQVLADLLTATGPVQLPDGSAITADNVVELTQKDQYAIFDDFLARKQYNVSILHAVSARLTDGSANPVRLAKALSRAAKQHRLLVWSADRSTEAVLAQTDYAGVIPDDDQPFAGLVLNNSAAGKLDYYLVRSLEYHRSGCGRERDVVATVQLRNTAPASGLPDYVTTRLDKHAYPTRPGDNRTILDFYATKGAQLQSVTLNGKPTTIQVHKERGHPVYRMELELPRGSVQTLVLHLSEPAGTGKPRIWQQPGVIPMAVRHDSQSCG